MPVSAWCYIPTQEQAAKTNMASMVRIQVFSIMQLGVAITSIWLIIPHEVGKAWKRTTIGV